MTKYKLTDDAGSRIVDIEEAEDSRLTKILDAMDLRADDMRGNINQVDAQVGLLQMRIDAVELRLTAIEQRLASIPASQ